MDVSENLQALVDELRNQFGAEKFYVVDITEDKARDEDAGTLVFGIRRAAVPVLAVRARTAQTVFNRSNYHFNVEVYDEPEHELEYLFDRYLRPYIASHDGIVTVERIDEPSGQLWISMEGGCSGCPSSIATLKHGIERTLKRHLPWVQRVDTTNEPIEPDFHIALDFSALSAGSPSSESERG